jgi:hypothetical protein
VLHVPSIGEWSTISFLKVVSAGPECLGDDVRTLPLRGQLVRSVTLRDASEYKIADHEGSSLYWAVVEPPEALKIALRLDQHRGSGFFKGINVLEPLLLGDVVAVVL